MSSNAHILERETRHAIFQQRLGGGIFNDVKPVLAKLRRDLVARLADAPTTYQANRINTLLLEVDELVRAAGGQMSLALTEQLRDFAQYEVEFQHRMLQGAISTSAVLPTPEAIAAMVTQRATQMADGTAETIPKMVERFTERNRRSVRLAVQAGYVEGATVQQMTRDVSRMVDTRTTRQAEALVRTATNHIGAVARDEFTKANADILKGELYSATLDSRTTLTCSGFDGQLFPVGEGPHPPLHYRCRSLRVPVIKDEFQVPGFEGERASQFGPVSSRTTYDGFLRRQSAEFQDEVLGPKRAALFRDGMPVKTFTDDDGRVLSLRELRAREGLTLA